MITTTIFRMDFIFPSMGIYVLMSHSTTPATTSAIMMDINDIVYPFVKYYVVLANKLDFRSAKKHVTFANGNSPNRLLPIKSRSELR